MSTNQAFIKAYRHDPARAASPAPMPSRVRQSEATVPLAAWQTSVEIVTADYGPPASPLPITIQRQATPIAAASDRPAIGKRPLSSFTAEMTVEPTAEPDFTPETTISAFHWPRICRTLWEQYADEYERVAELLLTKCRNEPAGGALIGVSGLHAGDGCTTTLLCLAVALAARKTRVILVDANFRSPRLAALLGAEPSTCWQDVLEHGLPVSEAVIRAESDNVDLLPLDARAPDGREPNGSQLAAGLQTSITAGVLRYSYDVALVDLGAILAPRSFAIMNHLVRNMRIGAAITVTDPKHAESDDLTVAGELLEECGCELLGVIENRSNLARKGAKEQSSQRQTRSSTET